MNSIFIISPYLEGGVWVFDDKERNLIKEPFVSGIPDIIEHFIKNKKFTVIFSDDKFPSFTATLIHQREEYNGNWYWLENTDLTGWLCPALLKYFKTAPKRIYLEFKE